MVYIPGNHDEFARDISGMEFGGVEVVDHVIHETADGRKMLVLHGDQFDIVVNHARWLAHLGDWAYDFAIWTNTWFNRAPKTRLALLVLLEMGQAQGEERRQFHRRFRGDARGRGAQARRRRRRSAAISITRRSATSTGSPMSTPAISSNPAPPSPNISTGRLELLHWGLLEARTRRTGRRPSPCPRRNRCWRRSGACGARQMSARGLSPTVFDRLAGGNPVQHRSLVMRGGVATAAEPGHFDGLQGALARPAEENNSLAGIARQLGGIEARQRHGNRARDMARRKFVGFAHVDERDRPVGKALFQILARDHLNHPASPNSFIALAENKRIRRQYQFHARILTQPRRLLRRDGPRHRFRCLPEARFQRRVGQSTAWQSGANPPKLNPSGGFSCRFFFAPLSS